MTRLAAAAALIALVTPGLAFAQLATPPRENLRLAYTTTSAVEVGFMELNSLMRDGDVVYGWSFNIFETPMPTPFHADPINAQWSRFSIDCAARTARFVQAIGLKDGVALFDEPYDYPVTPVAEGWQLDAAYACDGATPERPVVTSLEDAFAQATPIMASDAWGTP